MMSKCTALVYESRRQSLRAMKLKPFLLIGRYVVTYIREVHYENCEDRHH